MKKLSQAQLDKIEASKKMIDQVLAMTDEQKQAIITANGLVMTCEGHALSLNNVVLVLSQSATALVVGGYNQWQKVGRQVKKGEKALTIMVPRIGKDAEGETKCKGFSTASVFGINQTEEIAQQEVAA